MHCYKMEATVNENSESESESKCKPPAGIQKRPVELSMQNNVTM